MDKVKEFERTGKFQNGITVNQLIEHLEGYKDIYGDNPITISIFGDEDTLVQLDYYTNALTIDVMECEE